MGFRIKSDSDDEKQYEASMKVYRKHLLKFDKNADDHLWKFFYWDFFHDGWIEEITFRNGADEVLMKITCPNIQRRKKDNSFEHFDVDFTCKFRDVLYFKFEKGRGSEDDETRDSGAFIYKYSEINTLSELQQINQGEEYPNYDSLIMEIVSERGPGYSSFIELIFRDVYIEAKENAAFQLMLVSPDFQVPIYLGEG